MSTLEAMIPFLIDLTRDQSPEVIDLTADTPPPSDQRPLSPSPALDRRATTPLLEFKPEDDVIIPETQAGNREPNDQGLDFEQHLPPPLDEDAVLKHLPPHSKRFPSREAVMKYLNDFAYDHGFALVITRSDPKSRKAYLGCICHGQKAQYLALEDPLLAIPGAAYYQREGSKRKARRTLKTGCMFKVYIKDRSLQDTGKRGRGFVEGGPESWSFDILDDEHNHPPLPPVAVAFMRRLKGEEKAYVTKEVRKGTAAMEIVRGFREQFPNRPLQPRDVWNLAYSVRQDERAGFSAAEATLSKMRDLGELHDAWLNDHGQLVGLAYTSSKARALTHRHPTGLFFDCTYKTNLYKLPLLHIVGSTATGQTFTSAVVLILRETTGWYEKAIRSALKILGSPPFEIAFVDREPALHNALRTINPSVRLIYCLWHLKENIKDRYAKDFSAQFGNDAPEGVQDGDEEGDSDGDDDDGVNDSTTRPHWRKRLGRFLLAWETYVVRAKTLLALQDGVRALRFEYSRYEGLGRALKYVTIDLLENKEHFVHAFTDKGKHYGQRSSSSIEGRHYKLKRNIKRSRADIFYLFEVIRRYIDDEWDRINDRSAEERTILARDLGSLFSQINGRVSRKCIGLLKHQVEAYKKEKKAQADAIENGIEFLPTRCLGSTRVAYGIPCSHDLVRLIEQHLPIPLDLIDRHWHLTSALKMDEVRATIDTISGREGIAAGQYERINPDGWDDVTPRVSNPPTKRSNQAENQRHRARLGIGRGNASGSAGGRGGSQATQVSNPPPTDPNTGRILSQGERVDGARVRARTCGHCGRTGHDLRKCPEGADERARRAMAKEARQESRAFNIPPPSQHYDSTPYH